MTVVGDGRQPTFKRAQARRRGVAVSAYKDLDDYDTLIRNTPSDFPGLPLMLRRREELAELAFGRSPALELHMEGSGVTGHSAEAESLARFIRSLDQAVKNLAKSMFGLARLSSSLQVTPGMGSVLLVVAPPATAREYSHQTASGPAERIESSALRRLVSIMTVASEDEDDPTTAQLSAAIHDLNGGARAALASFAKAITVGQYDLRGTWTEPARESSDFRLTSGGASRLDRAASETVDRVDYETLTGRIDGWEWSTSRIRFIPEHGRSFRASVPDRLAGHVAGLISERDRDVLAQFAVHTRMVKGGSLATRRGFALESIKIISESTSAED